MSTQRSGIHGDEVVVEVQSEEMEDEAKGSCSKGLDSSATNQISEVAMQVSPHSPEIARSRFSSAPFSNETLTTTKSSRSVFQPSVHIDSDDIVEEKSNIEQDGSTFIRSPLIEEDDDEEEEEDNYEGASSSKKVNTKMLMMEYIVFLCSLGVLVASLTVKKLENLTAWGLEMWKCSVLVMLVFCGMLLTNWVLTLLVFVIERSFLMKKKVLYLVYGMKKTVQIFLWLGMVLLSWLFFFKFNHGTKRSKTSTKILGHITWTLVSLLIGAFLWMLSTLLFKTVATKFMADAYFDRIQEFLFQQYVIEALLGPPSFEKDAKKFASLRRMKSLVKKVTNQADLVRKVSVEAMDTLVEAALGNNLEIRSEWEAKVTAKKIFQNVAKAGSRYIEQEDLKRFITREDVDTVFSLFEGATETGQIRKQALKNWMVNGYLERKALALSLIDTQRVLKQLQQFFNSMVIVITIVVWLLLVGIASTNLVVFLSTQFLLAAFMFGNTCKNVFEAIVFIFVQHPFDVGDRIVVDDVPLVVEEMNVLTTTLLKPNNEKVYYPNSVLCTKTISNYYRSPDMGDTVQFSIVLTPVAKIEMLKKRIKEYLDSKPHHWRPSHSLVVIDVEDVNKLKMALNVGHSINFQQIEERNKRRTELVIELMRSLEELDITYNLLPQQGSSPHTK